MPQTTPADDPSTPRDADQSWWQRLRQRRSTRWAIDIFLIVAVLVAVSAFQSRHLLGGDEPLPPMTVQNLDGQPLDLADLDSRRTVIYFWATWCGACSLQSSVISSLHESADEDLDVISIVLSYDHPQTVADHIEENDIDYPVYLGTPALAQAYKVDAFPTTYIVDDNLQVRHGLVGYKTGFGLRARLLW